MFRFSIKLDFHPLPPVRVKTFLFNAWMPSFMLMLLYKSFFLYLQGILTVSLDSCPMSVLDLVLFILPLEYKSLGSSLPTRNENKC